MEEEDAPDVTLHTLLCLCVYGRRGSACSYIEV